MMPDRYSGSERAAYVRSMFASIAGRYDLMNRLMTAGRDTAWRKEVIRRAGLSMGDHLLDLGAGTGDLAREALRQQPGCRVTATDFTLEMMRVGQMRAIRLPASASSRIDWCAGDALRLPFPNETFAAVVSGFLIRNVTDLEACLMEQRRVLKPGGRIILLDTTQPRTNLFTPLVQFHLRVVIPRLGRWVSGHADAYTYLPGSTKAFLTGEELVARLHMAGFGQVGFQRKMFGTIAIHWAVNPGKSGD